jgi:mRNA interferase MazF
MVEVSYRPARGDLVWMEFDPQSGREQAGTRPAIVLSSAQYNSRARLAVICPITSQVKGYPFEVPLPDGLPIKGVVLADQVRSLDWHTRRARFIAKAPAETVDTVTGYATGIVQGK